MRLQWYRGLGKEGSHFDPNSDLFVLSEREDVLRTTLCCSLMVSLLLGLAIVMGPMWILKLYDVPYWTFVIWLNLVTCIIMATRRKFPGIGERGGLSSLDCDYGLFNNIHHDIGTHVIHHMFPQIPHYHLVEAVPMPTLTEAAKPVLGKYYREPKKSCAFPIELIKPLVKSMAQDHYVKYDGDIVFYQSDADTHSLGRLLHIKSISKS
eukprot:Gb_32148 [translate_table: standard]